MGHFEFQTETKRENEGEAGPGGAQSVLRVQLHAGRETHVCPDGAGGLTVLRGEGEEG